MIRESGKLVGTVEFKGMKFEWNGEQFMCEYPIREAWRLEANGHKALLELEQEEGYPCRGRLTFDELGVSEELSNVCFGNINGMLFFKRPKGGQLFEGSVINNSLSGNFLAADRTFQFGGHRVDNCGEKVEKEWRVKIEEHMATLQVSVSVDGRVREGRICFEELKYTEPLEEVYYNPRNGRIWFKRKEQIFEGSTVANLLSGNFCHEGSYFPWSEVSESLPLPSLSNILPHSQPQEDHNKRTKKRSRSPSQRLDD